MAKNDWCIIKVQNYNNFQLWLHLETITEETTLEETTEILKVMLIDLNLDPTFRIMIVFKENLLEEIITMHQN